MRQLKRLHTIILRGTQVPRIVNIFFKPKIIIIKIMENAIINNVLKVRKYYNSLHSVNNLGI